MVRLCRHGCGRGGSSRVHTPHGHVVQLEAWPGGHMACVPSVGSGRNPLAGRGRSLNASRHAGWQQQRRFLEGGSEMTSNVYMVRTCSMHMGGAAMGMMAIKLHRWNY